ncbi:MAG: 2-oxoisovalerate dehydrogenase [Sulfobacillus acidophilus]|uniref:2-oxoisovalerate dehydrogenase subunit alpha n=1 Tax=Sulfobacillus acidophilus TaxID=53633 RepID=A0A2T2WLM6_9FIRM|nr:MAG: 2-oxoisovalerate dehydrogenase [Sulfobacillus acidophilus]
MPENSDLDAEQLRTMYYYMVLSRELDRRIWILNRQGKSAFVISGQGQEGVQVGAAMALDVKTDWLAPYYRDMAMVLAFGMSAREVMLGQLGKAADPSSGGRQMPSHFGHRAKRILTGSSPVTTQVVHAVGMAWAAKLKGDHAVVLTSLGEGSTNQGEFHEALNFASVQRVPVIVLVENNGYSISVPQSREMAIRDVAVRAQGYGMPGVVVQGSDPLAVYQVVAAARTKAITGGGPTLIEAKTHRFTAHSSDDDDRSYRSRQQLADEKKDDAVIRFQHWLITAQLWDDERERALKARVRHEVDDATEYALLAALPAAETMSDHVYGYPPA